MIQRLQTVFLFLAILSIGLFLWLPSIKNTGTDFETQILKGWELRERFQTPWGVYFYYLNPILLGTAAGFSLITIFLYKWRKVQMVFTWFSVPFILAAAAFTLYKWQTFESPYIGQKLIAIDVYLTPFNIFLLLALLFQVFAFVYIRKDEKLIKSLDRLR